MSTNPCEPEFKAMTSAVAERYRLYSITSNQWLETLSSQEIEAMGLAPSALRENQDDLIALYRTVASDIGAELMEADTAAERAVEDFTNCVQYSSYRGGAGGKLINAIRAAVTSGMLQEPFGAKDVRKAVPGFADKTYGVFLPKHRQANPGGNTELFIRVKKGLYRLIW